MMKNLQHFIFVLALWYATSALAVTAIFYQPQTRDFEVNTQNWPVIFSAVTFIIRVVACASAEGSNLGFP